MAITALAAAMAAASTWQRADATLDRVLWTGAALTAVVAVHFPVLLRRSLIVGPVWALGFAFLLYGHFTFFYNAGQRAVEARAAESVHAKGLQDKRALVEAQLATIKSRPAATVAALLARAPTPERAQALQIELEESQRAAKLRETLFALADEGANAAVTDPVAARLAAVTGVTPATIGTLVSVMGGLLVEILGMLLWREVLRPSENAPKAESEANQETQIRSVVPMAEPTDLERLRRAVELGECKATVAGIRVYLGCGTDRAMKLSRELKQPMAA